MKAILVPTSLDEKISLIEFKKSNELDAYYKAIGCHSLDFVCLYNNGEYSIDCIVDDEGLLNGSPINEFWEIPRCLKVLSYSLAGKVIICMTDRRSGDSIDLDDLDVEIVKRFLVDNLCFDESSFDF